MKSVTYILTAETVDYCILVDCGEYDNLKPVLEKPVKAVLLTHGHSDHISGLTKLLEDFPDVVVYSTEYGHTELRDSRKNMSFYHGVPFTIGGYHAAIVRQGDVICFNQLADVEVIETPGHTKSCLSYKIGCDLFTGDAYLPGLKVFAKFPGGDKVLAEKSLNMLIEMECNGCVIHCGHHSYTR